MPITQKRIKENRKRIGKIQVWSLTIFKTLGKKRNLILPINQKIPQNYQKKPVNSTVH